MIYSSFHQHYHNFFWKSSYLNIKKNCKILDITLHHFCWFFNSCLFNSTVLFEQGKLAFNILCPVEISSVLWKRWEYQTTLPATWEICMQIKKKQLEPDMEQRTDCKLGKECVKAVYCHPAYLTSMQSTSCEMPGWMKHKLESRLPGETSIASDMQIIQFLPQTRHTPHCFKQANLPPWI